AQDGINGVLDGALLQTENTGGPVVVSGVTLAPGASSQRSAAQYSKGVVQDTIARILSEGAAQYQPNVYMTLSAPGEAKSTLITGKLALSAVFKLLKIEVDNDLNIQKSEDTTDLFARFLQDYYTVSAPQPNVSAQANPLFFASTVKPGTLTQLGVSAF